MINSALSSPGPNSRFLRRSTMEHVYGILLDEKFLYRSVHAAFVNTKWYEAWSERTLFLDPVICNVREPGVLSRMQGQACNCHRTRHRTSITSRSVAAAAASSLMRFSPGPFCRGESLVGVRVHQSCWLCLTPSLCVHFRRVSSLLMYFRRVSSLLVFRCFFLPAAGAARPHGKLCVLSLRTHLLDLFLSLCGYGARQVRVACAKPQTSREVDQDPEGGLTRQRNARPSFLITCCV